MEIVSSPSALPGSCFRCSSTNREEFVDLQMDIEFHGAIYLCDECIFEMARALGMETRDKVTALKLETESRLTRVKELEGQVTAQKEIIDGYHNYLLTLGIASDSVVSDSVAEPTDSEGFSGAEESLGEGEGSTPEPSDDEGVAELPPTPSKQPSFNI